MPKSNEFREALLAIFAEAITGGDSFLELKANDLHRRVGGYPGPQSRMPVCCGVMRKEMQAGDTIIEEPPSGQGANFTIRYSLPRPQSLQPIQPRSPLPAYAADTRRRQPHHAPSVDELARARELFEQNEPRDLFYRVATELVRLVLENPSQVRLSMTEALAVLLQTWNKVYYRFHKFDAAHFKELETTLHAQEPAALTFRSRKLETFKESDFPVVLRLYTAFERVLHPVGAVKTLHLLAPGFFPLWDDKIAAAYRCRITPKVSNAECYVQFMGKVREECMRLRDTIPQEVNVVKAIDEFNYCCHAKNMDVRLKFFKGFLTRVLFSDLICREALLQRARQWPAFAPGCVGRKRAAPPLLATRD